MTSAYNTADAIHIALTSARSLIERAQDSTREVIGSQITKKRLQRSMPPDSSSSPLSFIFYYSWLCKRISECNGDHQ